MNRPDRARRRDVVVEVGEEIDPVADTFAVVAYIGSAASVKTKIDTLGGFIRGWSAFTPELQDKVRRDLRAETDKQIQAWRKGQIS